MRRARTAPRSRLDYLYPVSTPRPALPPIETIDRDAEGREHLDARAAEALAHQMAHEAEL
jgi:hypothetical protein